MKFNTKTNEDQVNNILQREKLEKQAAGVITSEILSKLKISVENLPQKCQNILQKVARDQEALDIDQLEPTTLALRQSREKYSQLEEEYEILKLKQKNAELQLKIDRNNRFLEELRRELVSSRESLGAQDPNPDNIHDYIRQLKHKVAKYEENCEKAQMKFSKLSVPESIHPLSLKTLMEARDALRHDAESLRLRADDVALVREARNNLRRLRK